MPICKYAVLFWALLLAAAAVAGHPDRTRIEIEFDKPETGEQTFRFDSEDAAINLDSLEVGESRAVTDDSGNVANILRTATGFEIEVAGETIVLDDLYGHDAAAMRLHADEHDVVIDTDVKKVRKIKTVRSGGERGVTVISSTPLDAATRESVRTALRDGGVDDEVAFIDSGDLDAMSESRAADGREIHVIRKRVDVTD